MFIWNLLSHFNQKVFYVAGRDCFDHVVFKRDFQRCSQMIAVIPFCCIKQDNFQLHGILLVWLVN